MKNQDELLQRNLKNADRVTIWAKRSNAAIDKMFGILQTEGIEVDREALNEYSFMLGIIVSQFADTDAFLEEYLSPFQDKENRRYGVLEGVDSLIRRFGLIAVIQSVKARTPNAKMTKHDMYIARVARAIELHTQGANPIDIGKELGVSDVTIVGYLKARANLAYYAENLKKGKDKPYASRIEDCTKLGLL